MVTEFFSNSYAEARARFLDIAKRHGLKVERHRHPGAKGPNGEPLFCDCAILGEDEARNVLIIQSGLHGVEGYCGSACQTGFLRTISPDDVPPGLKIVLIHAINPFGFAWDRRVNEDNVDLNRNFLDHSCPYPENTDFRALYEGVVPENLSPESLAAADSVLRGFAQEHGPRALQDALTRGQYDFPDAPYFGGMEASWSNTLFRDILSSHCTNAELVTLIDIHTGLGEYGAGEIILEVEPADPAYELARDWWGSSVKSTVSGESVSVALSGTIDNVLFDLPKSARGVCVALEFGTRPGTEVFGATRADNWLHQRGDLTAPEASQVKAAIRDAFYPDSDDWKQQIWACAEGVILKAIRNMA